MMNNTEMNNKANDVNKEKYMDSYKLADKYDINRIHGSISKILSDVNGTDTEAYLNVLQLYKDTVMVNGHDTRVSEEEYDGLISIYTKLTRTICEMEVLSTQIIGLRSDVEFLFNSITNDTDTILVLDNE